MPYVPPSTYFAPLKLIPRTAFPALTPICPTPRLQFHRPNLLRFLSIHVPHYPTLTIAITPFVNSHAPLPSLSPLRRVDLLTRLTSMDEPCSSTSFTSIPLFPSSTLFDTSSGSTSGDHSQSRGEWSDLRSSDNDGLRISRFQSWHHLSSVYQDANRLGSGCNHWDRCHRSTQGMEVGSTVPC